MSYLFCYSEPVSVKPSSIRSSCKVGYNHTLWTNMEVIPRQCNHMVSNVIKVEMNHVH